MKLAQQFLLSCIFLVYSLAASAQKNHFIYLQTDNKQPFYVKLDKKIYSSSIAGYVIIPKLINGEYNFAIGFPKNEWPEQNVTFTLKDNDAGYLIKNFGEKGWGFYNLQTASIVMANTTKKEQPTIAMQKPEPVVEERKPEVVVKEEVKTLPTIAEKTPDTKPEIVTEETKAPIKETPQPTLKKEAIKIKSFTINAAGTEGVYIVTNNDKEETVSIFIPADKEEIKQPVVEQLPEAPKQEAIKLEEKKIEILPAEIKKEEPIVKSAVTIPNSNCRDNATEDDFIKLRRKMVAEDNDDDMIAVARKLFKTKCFAVAQIKNLSTLFLNDEGKYKLFDAAYAYASDSENFVTLEAELKDSYFINRFKSMMHH